MAVWAPGAAVRVLGVPWTREGPGSMHVHCSHRFEIKVILNFLICYSVNFSLIQLSSSYSRPSSM